MRDDSFGVGLEEDGEVRLKARVKEAIRCVWEGIVDERGVVGAVIRKGGLGVEGARDGCVDEAGEDGRAVVACLG